MNKKFKQVTRVRTKLSNKYLKLKSEINRLAYVKQRNSRINWLRQKKRIFLKVGYKQNYR